MLTGLRSTVVCGLIGALLAAAPAAAQSKDDPLARFADPLCPGVSGLEPELAAAMVGRMRSNAEALGLRMAKDGECTANLIVAFVSDAGAYLSRVESSAGYLFANLNLDERRALLAGPGPVHVVHQVVPRSRDGRPIPRHRDQSDVPQTAMWMAHSKIYAAIRNDITYSLVLIDRDRIADVNIRQLADYATFRGLSQLVPSAAAAGEGSILTLFGGDEARPGELTRFDRAYLAALYSGQPNLPASAKLAEIARATGTTVVAE